MRRRAASWARRFASRRLSLGLLAWSLVFGCALSVEAVPAAAQQGAETASAPVSLAVARLAGADRYETSLEVAEAVAEFGGGRLGSVVLVSGERWNDAAVAAALAGLLSAPVLMTPPDGLRDGALEFMKRTGVSTAIVVGAAGDGDEHGSGRGVGDASLAAPRAAGVRVQRLEGSDRYGTAIAVARRITPGEMPGLGRTAIVANGEVFADALVSGPIAAHGPHPLVLTPPDELHPDAAAYLSDPDAGIEHVIIMGGNAAVAESVEETIARQGITVTRLGGSTRYDTAVLAAELVANRNNRTEERRCIDARLHGLANAHVPFDSFSAAPLLGLQCASLLLTDRGAVPRPTAVHLDLQLEALVDEPQRPDSLQDAGQLALFILVFGGEAVVQIGALSLYLSEAWQRIAEDRAGQIDPATDDPGAAQPDDRIAPGDCGGAPDSVAQRLVASPNAEDPDWSPDCSRLVFTEGAALWTVANDGTDQQPVLWHDEAYLSSPSWSPSGEQIAYERGYQDGDRWVSHIWAATADGRRARQLTHGSTSRDRWPRWSPDGTKIVFDRTQGDDRFIAVMDAHGNNYEALTTGGPHEQAPHWSPDGTKLAYISQGTLYIAQVDGSDPQPAATDVYPNGQLAWSPTSDRIAFTRQRNDTSDIYITNTDGSNQRQVTALPSLTLAPRWSPDGKLLAFHTIARNGRHRAWTIGTDRLLPQ